MCASGRAPPPQTVELVVEVPRGGFVKRRVDGTVDYVSPLPSPFNYGCVPDMPADDGDPLDVVLLGPRRPVGHRAVVQVRGVVRFVDAGAVDNKLVCAEQVPSTAERAVVRWFFTGYAVAKGWLNRARGKGGRTRLIGVVWGPRVGYEPGVGSDHPTGGAP